MKDRIYIGLREGVEVCRGTYEEVLHTIGKCNEFGWYLPYWEDVAII